MTLTSKSATVTVAQALEQAVNSLRTGQTQTPGLDAELLLGAAMGCSRATLKAFPERTVGAESLLQFLDWIDHRVQGQPIAYLLKEQGFWTLDLEVSPDVLIPRPETELLVEHALQLADEWQSGDDGWALADLGTGSGAIALALASERPQWQVCATDISKAALAVAQSNAQRLQLQVRFLHGAWCKALPSGSRWNMIVSNPPYISDHDPHLAQGDLRFEPRTALVAADAGFQDLQNIASQARGYLLPDGWLLFEHGYSQGEELKQRLQALGYADVHTVRDLAGHERVTGGRWPGNTGPGNTGKDRNHA